MIFENQAGFRNLRRLAMAAAAAPNNTSIGGAGTSVPLDDPDDVEPPELVELELDVDEDVELDEEVELDVELELDDEVLVELVTLPDEVEVLVELVTLPD
ncbi:MAG: hypothetical protein JSR96_06850, partial [Proteobacteria bacterium]|nr:hypothetical protein [Pseudomonadota bacterium]